MMTMKKPLVANQALTTVEAFADSKQPGQIPVAAPQYTWKDTYFSNDDGIVAVFDFDYDAILEFEWAATKARWAVGCCQEPIVTACCLVPCFARRNIEWATRAKHVAVTKDGIKLVLERRKTMCGFSCSDVGRESKTVPFDKLTDCDVKEPAGTAVCCFVPQTLSTVKVDTASSSVGPGSTAELTLRGLRDPHGFKRCVWDCKRHAVNMGPATVPAAMSRMGGGGGADLAPLLTEIRDELREQTKLYRSVLQVQGAPQTK